MHLALNAETRILGKSVLPKSTTCRIYTLYGSNNLNLVPHKPLCLAYPLLSSVYIKDEFVSAREYSAFKQSLVFPRNTIHLR